MFFLSSFFWSASMATHCLLAVKLQVPLPSLSKYIKYYHIVSWGIPLIFAFIPIILENVNGNDTLYADSRLWCWIPDGELGNLLRMVIFYGPLWAIFLYNIAVYIYIGVKVLESRRNINKLGTVANRNQKPIQKFAMKTGVYMLAFFFNWGFGTINRIQNIFDPDNPSFALFLLHGITVPLGGCLNAIIFFYFARETSSSSSSKEDRSPINSSNNFSSNQSFKSNTMSSYSSSVRPIIEKSKNGTTKSYKSTSSFGKSANSPSPTIKSYKSTSSFGKSANSPSPTIKSYKSTSSFGKSANSPSPTIASAIPHSQSPFTNNSSPIMSPLSAILFPSAPSTFSSMPNTRMSRRTSMKGSKSDEKPEKPLNIPTDNYSTGW
jgi:hypothetical protein